MSQPYLPPLIPPAIVWVALIAAIAMGVFACLLFLIGWISLANFARLVALAVVLFCAGLFGLLVASLPTLSSFYLPAFFNSPFAAAGAVAVGLGLYWLKKNRLHLYALLEIVGAGGTMLVCALTSYGSPFARAVALLTATYFLVRGLENAEKGGLPAKIKERMRKFGAGGWFVMAVAILSAVYTILTRRPDLAPPYMANRNGSQIPVSPIQCGGFFIVCDEASWRERDRLLRGTAADRAQAEREAERRSLEQEARPK